MKAYEIALFLIMLNASFNIINASGIFGDSTLYYGQGILSSIQSIAPPSGTDIGILEFAVSLVGLVIQSLIALLMILCYATILLPFMFWQIGLPAVISGPLTLGVWIAYAIGYNQWKSGRNIGGLE